MPEPKSSLNYWSAQWAANPWEFGTSWKDCYARLLELEFVRRQLSKVSGRVLDMGCGNLQLAESQDLFWELAERGYLGVDGAPAAVEVATMRVSGMANMDVALEDFTRKEFGLAEYRDRFGVFLSKRVLQNLTPEERQKHWRQVLQFEHGILVEGTQEGMLNTSVCRTERGMGACTPPRFNYYLEPEEVDMLKKNVGAEVVPFMAHYMFETRGRRDLRVWDSEVHRAAYKQNIEAIRSGADAAFPVYGPTVAIVW